MANIELAIDIDSSSVTQADTSLDRFDQRLRGVSGNFGGVASASQKADRGVRGFADATAQAEKRTASAVSQYQKMAAVWVTLGAVAGGALVSGMVRLSDEYTEITNKLKVVASEQTNVNDLFDRLTGIANATRSPIDAIATLYQRAALNAKELGASQADLMQFTENVGKALAIQGGSAEAASGALLQLSQSLGSGTVHAEEFNSILEGALPIAQAAAKGITAAGGSVAKLRALVIDGKVSSDAFFKAILSQSKELEASFAKTSPTIGQAFTVLHNNMVSLSRESQGIMSLVAQGIIFVGDNLERLAVYAATAAAVFAGKFAVGLALAAVETGTLAGALGVLKGALITTGIGALIVGAGELAYQFLQLVKATGSWGEALNLLGEVAAGVWEGIKTSASAIVPGLGAVWEQVKAGFYGVLSDLAGAWGDFLNSMASLAGGVPGLSELQGALTSMRDKADQFSTSMGDAWDAASAKSAQLATTASGDLSTGFGKAAEAVAKLRDKMKEAEGNTLGANDAASKFSGALDDTGKKAKKVADALASAKEVLRDQQRAYADILEKQKNSGQEVDYIREQTSKLEDALDKSGVSLDQFLKTVGLTREEYTRMLGETEKVTKQIDYQAKAAQGMVDALKGLAFGTLDVGQGIGGLFQSLTDGAFGEKLDDTFKEAGKSLSEELGKAMKGIGSATGLSGFGPAAIGTGIGIAFTGAVQGNVQQIGSGIGSAIGGALGDAAGPALASAVGGSLGTALGVAAGPLGMVAGSLIGGFISKMFKGSTWKDATVEAFSGTTYSSEVTTRYNTANDGASPIARAAMLGVENLLKSFDSELGQYIDGLGGTMKRGTDLVVNQQKALKAITGYASEFDAPRDGRSEQAAQEIAAKVAEIMGLASTIAAKAGPQLTNAQQLWRATQEKFSEENVQILRSLGFSAREIYQAQGAIKRDLAKGFEQETLQTLVDTGRATSGELDKWKASEIASLEDRRKAAMATAREIGADVGLVQSSFRAQRRDIVGQWREMLADITKDTTEAAVKVSRKDRLSFAGNALNQLVDGGSTGSLTQWRRVQRALLGIERNEQIAAARKLGVDVTLIRQLYAQKLLDVEKTYAEKRYQAVVDAAATAMERLTGRLNGLESRRSEVLQELTQRADEARKAEQALADARASLTTGELNPGGPMDRFKALQAQFGASITAARGGDAEAASQAASLAQSLLQAGRGVYASGGGYADLFKMVNQQLLGAQNGFGGQASQIEKRLDATTFVETSERSTKALLTALGTLNGSISRVEHQIARQTRQQERLQQRQSVGK